mmetsp:Transcript_53905/g.161295  ORF Transcript_53905/g.161295 Transcript_53905/m.161295 type:complete len:295 (-) Transcript_53905:1322-2206(-)
MIVVEFPHHPRLVSPRPLFHPIVHLPVKPLIADHGTLQYRIRVGPPLVQEGAYSSSRRRPAQRSVGVGVAVRILFSAVCGTRRKKRGGEIFAFPPRDRLVDGAVNQFRRGEQFFHRRRVPSSFAVRFALALLAIAIAIPLRCLGAFLGDVYGAVPFQLIVISSAAEDGPDQILIQSVLVKVGLHLDNVVGARHGDETPNRFRRVGRGEGVRRSGGRIELQKALDRNGAAPQMRPGRLTDEYDFIGIAAVPPTIVQRPLYGLVDVRYHTGDVRLWKITIIRNDDQHPERYECAGQ